MKAIKMGTEERKKRERNLRREQIMRAAKIVFSAKGFRGSTMEEIAEIAELSPGTLYSYFKSKDDLYASLNIKILEYLYKETEGLYDDKSLSSTKKIESLSSLFYEVYRAEPLILLSLFNLQSSKDFWNLSDNLVDKINGLAAKGFKAMTNIFEDAAKEGAINEFNPNALSDIIWAIFTGLLLWEESKKMSNPERSYFKETLELATEIFCYGIKRR
jgi:AcrR family transcriptional regulator